MFENTEGALLLTVLTTSPLTGRRRWKVMTPARVLLDYVFALVKHDFGVGCCTGRVVSLRNSIPRTSLHSLCPCLLVGSLTRRTGESSAEECLNLFENTRGALVLAVDTTSPLMVRRRWKLMAPACGLLSFILALVKYGFGVGCCTGRVVSLRNPIGKTPWHSFCPCLLVG